MSMHETNIEVFNDTLELINNSDFLKQKINDSIDTNKIYKEDDELNIIIKGVYEPNIILTRDRTLNAVKKLYSDGCKKVAVLSFANQFVPGGGVLNGSSSQEESICRISTLYPVINSSKAIEEYYNYNKNRNDCLSSNRMIYSKDIQIIKTDDVIPKRLDEANYYSCDVITCAAPDVRYFELDDLDTFIIFRSRIERIIQVALLNNVDGIVLGAFGCGVFHNNPYVVARAMNDAIKCYKKSFKEICFAVFSKDNGNENYDAFSKYVNE